jgi:acetyltransferase-like isoleucine patch superfamily enzyme
VKELALPKPIGNKKTRLHVSSLYRWAALSEHWAAAVIRRTRSALRNLNVPAPRGLSAIVLTIFIVCRGICKNLLRVFICEPCFKSYCSSYGKRLRTTSHLPWIQGRGKIIVGDDFSIYGKIVILFALRYSETPQLVIGDRTSIGHQASFAIGKGITIGNDCLIGNEVILFDSPGHPTNPVLRLQHLAAPSEAVKPIFIGDNVWIGQRSIVYPGVSIGKGAVVTAGSVVMNDVAPETIVAGNPARRTSLTVTSKPA